MATRTSRRFLRVSKGLGQLEAYIDAEEGVAFQMDNELIWDCVDRRHDWPIQGAYLKTDTCKFGVTLLPSGKVMLRDWTGMYLAPRSPPANRSIHPLRPVPYSENASLQFEVFYRGNKVAFRAYNGLFLARIYRNHISFHAIEAVRRVTDESCCFRPMIGDVHIPTFKIIKVAAIDFSEVKCSPCVLKKEVFYNRSDVLQTHTFSITWETISSDRVFWDRLWGLGLPVSCNFEITDTTATVKYTEDNEKTVITSRVICEKHEKTVDLPPKTKATARLMVFKHDTAAFPFRATIRKERPNGELITLRELGSWTGILYQAIQLEVVLQPLSDHTTTCTAM